MILKKYSLLLINKKGYNKFIFYTSLLNILLHVNDHVFYYSYLHDRSNHIYTTDSVPFISMCETFYKSLTKPLKTFPHGLLFDLFLPITFYLKIFLFGQIKWCDIIVELDLEEQSFKEK